MRKFILLSLLSAPIIGLATEAQMYVTNGTGCLVEDNNQVHYGKPIPFYVFSYNKDTGYKYANVAVAPGQRNASVPMFITPGTSPPAYGLFIGTDPHDAPAHITINVPTGTSALIVQEYNSQPGNACKKDYPCVGFAIGQTAQQCLTLLNRRHYS